MCISNMIREEKRVTSIHEEDRLLLTVLQKETCSNTSKNLDIFQEKLYGVNSFVGIWI